MMSALSTPARPRLLLAAEQAAFPPQLLRCGLLISLRVCHSSFGFYHKLFSGCSDCQGHFTAEGFLGSADITRSLGPFPNLGDQMCLRISQISGGRPRGHSECSVRPQPGTGRRCFEGPAASFGAFILGVINEGQSISCQLGPGVACRRIMQILSWFSDVFHF